jgi:hypothetical protein
MVAMGVSGRRAGWTRTLRHDFLMRDEIDELVEREVKVTGSDTRQRFLSDGLA